VPTSDGEWKAHTVFTNLEDLKAFPEKKGALRDPEPNHGRWEEDRRREREFEDREPVVVIIGGGQSGLDLAARLKCLDVPTLVVEKNPRIGDNWRNRYEALCLHDPVCEYTSISRLGESPLTTVIRVRSHAIPPVRTISCSPLQYSPSQNRSFPPTWPVYAPALKLANWLESYASSLDLNVWTSSTVANAAPDASGSKWTVAIKRSDGERVFKEVRHVVFATGLGGGDEGAKLPVYPGMVSVVLSPF
jgi:cation diffusion facilitator CzcD-associated flavoprotein CzcO